MECLYNIRSSCSEARGKFHADFESVPEARTWNFK